MVKYLKANLSATIPMDTNLCQFLVLLYNELKVLQQVMQILVEWRAHQRVYRKLIAPILAKIFNKSILLGKVPLVFKSCSVTPLIKKSTIDPSDVCSYRPISNLCLLKASGTSRTRQGYGSPKSSQPSSRTSVCLSSTSFYRNCFSRSVVRSSKRRWCRSDVAACSRLIRSF